MEACVRYLYRQRISEQENMMQTLNPLTGNPESELIASAQSGDTEAMAENFQSFRAEASFKTWITRIVMNQCLGLLRKPDRHCITLTLDLSGSHNGQPLIAADSLTPEKLVLKAEISRAVAEAAASLPKPLRDVFTRCSSGVSIRETATALGLTVPATKTRLFRARSLLRRKLQTKFAGRITPSRSEVDLRS